MGLPSEFFFEHRRPLVGAQIGRNCHAGLLVRFRQQTEQQ